jgi:hypothetical protein
MNDVTELQALIPTADNPTIYRSLLDETFLKPIRSVLIVDDEFPTLEKLLSQQDQSRHENIQRLQELIAECRNENRRWLVDVHDGSESSLVSGSSFQHMHQSDLLILDYHLDGGEGNSKALNILRTLAQNDHFNLVVVYTNGYGGDVGLSKVGVEIASSLTFNGLHDQVVPAAAAEMLESWEDDDDNIYQKLHESIDINALLEVLNSSKLCKWQDLKSLPSLSKLRQLIDARQTEKREGLSELAERIILERLSKDAEIFSANNFGKVKYSLTQNIWIRTNKLFITVIGKTVKPSEIPSKLLDSLENWDPSPHRLLMTKIRAELENVGAHLEQSVLDQKYIQAGWLHRMLQSNPHERPWRIRETTSRHWEEMAFASQTTIQNFAKRLFSTIPSSENSTDYVLKHTGVNVESESDSIKTFHNCYVCSKEVEGHHLMPGHILEIPVDTRSEFWLCLSPACDLVPGQGSKWGAEETSGLMPFKSVMLHEVTQDKALGNATSNQYLFVRVNGKMKAFSFLRNPNSNPEWEQMFAHGNGAVKEDDLNIEITRVTFGSDGVKTKNEKCELVAQLRYEYALNLLQKLGASLSRVGLDFIKK